MGLRHHLLGVPVRRRNDRLAAAYRVGERPGDNLFPAEVRRDVNVTGKEELAELIESDVLVEEDDVVLDALLLDAIFERHAVHFPLAPLDFRVRRAEDDVGDVGKVLCDVGNGVYGVLDALVRADEAERQHHRPPLHLELLLVLRRVDERHVRHAVVGEAYLFARDAVNVAQHFPGARGHHHHRCREARDLLERLPLPLGGLLDNRVKGGDDGFLKIGQQRKDMAAVRPSEDAELVLEAYDLDRGDVEEIGCFDVVALLVSANFEGNLGAVWISLGLVVYGHDAHRAALAEGFPADARNGTGQIVGKGGNAAVARHVRTDEGGGNTRKRQILCALSHFPSQAVPKNFIILRPAAKPKRTFRRTSRRIELSDTA